VSIFAAGEIAPLVSEMDATSTMDEGLIEALFANGLMGVEVAEEYGGTGASFTTMCAVIEELATVDPAVSTCVDVHSTVVNNTIAFWANDELKAKVCHYMTQPLVELYGGCVVVLKVS
jgi:alkylation response protein AidB-like acyl-CoA dehydrogenase